MAIDKKILEEIARYKNINNYILEQEDPALAGGMPPMDPNAMPPADPNMGGMPPADPNAMPPADPNAAPPPRHSPASGHRHPASINSRQRAPLETPTANSTSHPTTDRRGYRGADSGRGWEARSRRRGRS